MDSFKELIEISDRLNDPVSGCPWDVKQNFKSLQKYILEEACELIDAVDDEDMVNIIEELGDLFYVVIFYCKVAEREGVFKTDTVINTLKEKLIRRHPHVFGDVKCETSEEMVKLWEEIKKEEKKDRKSLLDGVPRSLAVLARAQKILSKLIEHEAVNLEQTGADSLGDQMIRLIIKAEHQGLDAEKTLREALKKYEELLKTL